MTMTGISLLLVPLWPALLALAAIIVRSRRVGAWLCLLGPLPAFIASVSFRPPVDATVGWLLLGTRFGINASDSVFLLFTAVIWFLASGFAVHWVTGKHGRRFFVLFLLTMTGNLGALVAQDMPGFYTFFSVMSFAAYALIAHTGSREAKHAANVYIMLVVAGEAALVTAMLLAAGGLGAFDFESVRSGLETLPMRHVIVALAFLGFGIKAGVLILHVWLPLAHPAAPAPASAVLSGTIIVTGLVGWMRFLPVGEWALPAWGIGCLVLGLAAAFYGVVVGIDQRRPKVLLAYSSISQMGIMTIGIGMLLLEPASADSLRVAIALFAMHHGLAKAALFLGAGLATTALSAAAHRWLLPGLAVPSLALAGAPFTSGVVAKSLLLTGKAGLPAGWAGTFGFLLPMTSVATALLLARFLLIVGRDRHTANSPAPRLAWAAWAVSVSLVVLLPLWLGNVAGFSWTVPKLFASVWPLAVALILAFLAVRLWRQAGSPRIPEVPAGDILLPLERIVASGFGAVVRFTGRLVDAHTQLRRAADAGHRRTWQLIQRSGSMEKFLGHWRVAVTLAVVLGAAIACLAAWYA